MDAAVDAANTLRLSVLTGTTEVSIATASELTEIPVPAPTSSVAAPDVAPPVRPLPATTEVMSPSEVTSSHDVPFQIYSVLLVVL